LVGARRHRRAYCAKAHLHRRDHTLLSGSELELIRPKLLILVGRLAITRFLPDLPLAELVGRTHEVIYRAGKATAVPLPHPSGASSWIHEGDHPQLLDGAIAVIGRELEQLGIGSGPRHRSVA
jgi:uracil-DNA glycosylase